MLFTLPILLAGGAWLGARFSVAASQLHPTVNLATRLTHDHAPPDTTKTGPLSVEELALARARLAPEQILAEAQSIQKRFNIGARIFGAWVGLVIGLKGITVSLRKTRTDFEPDRGACLACGRCFEYCPNERVRRGDSQVQAHDTAAELTGPSPVRRRCTG